MEKRGHYRLDCLIDDSTKKNQRPDRYPGEQGLGNGWILSGVGDAILICQP